MLGILAFRLIGTPFGRAMGASPWIAPTLCLVTMAAMTMQRTDLAVVLLFPRPGVSLASGTHLPYRILVSAPAEFLGKLSYSIYLVHDLFGGVLGSVHGLTKSSGLAHAQTYGAVVCISLTFPIAYIAYRFIEVPGRQWLRVLFGGRPIPIVAAEPAGAPTWS